MADIDKLYNYLSVKQEYSSEEQLLQDLTDQEQEYITSEVIPFLKTKLARIRRAFTLSISFNPGEELNFSLSHANSVNEEGVVSVASPNTPLDQKKEKQNENNKEKVRDILCVILPDGTTIEKQNAKDTYVEAIRVAGVERVRTFKKMICGKTLLYEGINPQYPACNQPVINDKYRVNTCFSTKRKKTYLEELSHFLNLGWKVVIK